MQRPVLIFLALTTASSVCAQEKNLFILSGQSMMKRQDPEPLFSSAVRKAFGEDRVIVVKNAEGGQSIRRWYKNWQDVKNYRMMKPDTSADPSTIGDLYDRLMKSVGFNRASAKQVLIGNGLIRNLNGGDNGVHYTRDGDVEFGKRLAEKAIMLID